MNTPTTKGLLFAAMMFGLWTAAAAHGRTFTNTEGKTIEAEVEGATATTVTLRLEDRRTSTVELGKLSQEDQDFVKAWLADRVPRMRFTPSMGRSSKDADGSSTGSSSYKTQSYKLSVEVRNEEAGRGLEESVLKFVLIGRSLTDNDEYKILAAQSEPFSLAPGGSTTVSFREVVNKYYDSKYSTSKSGYKCVGHVIYAERKKDSRALYSYASMYQFEEHIPVIAALESGDVTNEVFHKAARAVGEDGEDRPGPDDPIIVR